MKKPQPKSYWKKYFQLNKERLYKQRKLWLNKNKKKVKEYHRAYFQKNKERLMRGWAKWRKNNLEKARENERKRYIRYKVGVMRRYGGKCANPNCPETELAVLTIDHINDDGYQDRKNGGGVSGSGEMFKFFVVTVSGEK